MITTLRIKFAMLLFSLLILHSLLIILNFSTTAYAAVLTDNGNKTVTDSRTGLVWQQEELGRMTWGNALRYCEGLSLGGQDDWRLPNVKELESLTDDARYNPSLDTTYFPNAVASYYWSSTTPANSPGYAWSVYFGEGFDGSYGKYFTMYVRCVRGGQSGSFGSLTLSPTSKDYGSAVTNSTSAAQAFTLSNIGTGNLVVSAITLTGADSGMFTMAIGDGTAGTCGATPTIAAAGSCTVSATFTPTSAGAKSTTLRIASNDPATPIKDVALSGTGELPTYTIGTIITGSGSITCTPSATVNQGDSTTCTATPDAGNYVASVTVDSAAVPAAANSGSYSQPFNNVTASHTMTATFNAKYTVTYNGNDSSSGIVPTDAATYLPGATVTALGNSGTLEKTGFTFGGWNTAEVGSGTTYAAGATFAIAGNTTLYAKWGLNGVCGTSYGTPFTVIPTANLCTSGTESTVTGSGPWSWSCNGSNGGTNASCWAYLQGTVVLPKTGQTACYDTAGAVIACAGTGQDGEKQMGAAQTDPVFTDSGGDNITDKVYGMNWLKDAGANGAIIPQGITGVPNPRFTDNNNGTQTDNLTGLVWLKNADCYGLQSWATALNSANSLKGDYSQCGLNDGSLAGDWRLPNINELASLPSNFSGDTYTWLADPAQGFTNVQADQYWSSSTYASDTLFSWGVHMSSGYVNYFNYKGNGHYVWPVRGGQSGSLGSLTSVKTGSGTGSVSSNPAGISCGTTCSASFADGQSVTLTATADSGSSFASWTGCDSTTSNQCTVAATRAKSVTATFAVNEAPTSTAITAAQVNETAAVNIDVHASYSDPNGDTLAYTLTGAPAWLNINSTSGIITGTAPSVTSDTPYTFTVVAKDPSLASTSQSMTLTVKNSINEAPTSTAITAAQVNETAAVNIDIHASFSDPNGDTLAFTLTGAPAWLNIGSSNGIITGTAASVTSDTPYTFTVVAKDPSLASTSQSMTLTVKNSINEAPTSTAISAAQVNETAAVNIDVHASFSDPNGDTLAFTLTGAPVWLSINSASGIITGTAPSVTSDTPYTFTVVAKDPSNAQTTQSMTLTVKNSINEAPTSTAITAAQVNETAAVNIDIHASFSDPNGDTLAYSLTGAPVWLSINSASGIITGTAPSVTSDTPYTFTVVAKDPSLAFTSQSMTLTVKNSINEVRFTSNGGSAVSNQTVTENTTATAPTSPTKTGNTFAGWYSDISLATPFVFTTAITADTTLYAKWTLNNYTVSYTSNGGSTVSNQSVAYNTATTAPTAPTKTGSTFAGWYSDAALTTAFAFTTAITGDITLYAKWTINNYTVSYTSNGGTAVTSQSVVYNTQTTAPTSPTKTGNTFAGWYTEAGFTNTFVFTTPITADTTLYAKWTLNSYTVSFTSNGGSAVSSQTVNYNTATTAPSAPTRTGYTFAGWYSDIALGNAFAFTTPITADTTLYAKWTINNYTVSFTSNGGSAVPSQSAVYNTATTSPTAPVKTGYTFAGWYSDIALSNAFAFTTPITADTTLYAKWTINSYTVSFTSNGGSTVPSQSAVYNTATTAPTAPSKTGRTFAGWFSDIGLANTFAFTTPITADTTLYAKWTLNSYTVSFTSNGGTAVANQSVVYNTATTAPTAPTKTGYTFAGWFSDIGLANAFAFTTPITANITLYAKWTVIPPTTYSVSFTSNGGSAVSNQTVTENTTATAPTAPTKTGNTFAGWYSDIGLANAFAFTTPITANTTLYAKWTVIPPTTYSVIFTSNGGSAVSNQTVTENTTATAPTAPTRTGYTFAGWYSDAVLTTPFVFTTAITGDITLYAKWTINNYTVSYTSNGGTAVTSQSVVYNTQTTAPTAPTKTGNTFAGWYTEAGLTTAFVFTTAITADITLYAKWTINNYTVSFSSNGGSSVTSQSVAYNTQTTAPTAPTKSGSTFSGWYIDAGLTTPFAFANAITTDTTLYAKWTLNNYTVIYTSNGGSTVGSQSVAYNTATTAPTAPTKSGNTFAGWFSDISLANAFAFTTSITANTTLYAKWTVIPPTTYSVSFTSNGGSAVSNQTVTENTTATAPTAPTRTGYTFAGWFSDTALTAAFVFTTPITANTTLYAKWTVIPPTTYTVSFTSNGGSAVSNQTVTENTTATVPTAPTKTGYTFAGWYSDTALTSAFAFTTSITANTTLYAKWTVIPPTTYSVSFTSNGGSAVSNQTVTENTTATAPTAPTRTGYTFAGWFSDTALTAAFVFTTPITANTTLYAKWTVIVVPTITYAVTPSAGTGSSMLPTTVQTITSGATTSFTITSLAGYGILSATGCNGTLSGSTYTTGAITGNCTVSVTAVKHNGNSGTTADPTITDALKALQAFSGIVSLTPEETIRYDIAPLAANGVPQGNGAVDIADVIMILRRSVGIGSW
jgi:uncharacterized repeat protein (TIGR02543 family)